MPETAGQPLAFLRSVHPAGEPREVTVHGTFFHIDAEIVMSADGDQAVTAAVRHIEADGGTPAAYHGERLAMVQVTEREIIRAATGMLGQIDAQGRPAEGECVPGPP